MVKNVKRKRSVLAPFLQGVMVLLAVLFLLMGVIFDRGFMLPCFLMAGLYYVYHTLSVREYEYILENQELKIDRILGHAMRRTALIADLRNLKILAPHDSAAVDRWRKGSGSRVKKYDFTSYEDIPYYTMIIRIDEQDVKLLLELDEEMLAYLKRHYPDSVERS